MKKELNYLLYGIDTSKKLLHSKWATPVNAAQIKEGLQHLVSTLHNKDVELWIHESRHLHELTKDDKTWIIEVLGLILLQSNLKYIAIVRPQGIEAINVGKAIRDKAYRIYGKRIGIEFFDTTEEAKAWILPNLQHYRLPALSSPVILGSM